MALIRSCFVCGKPVGEVAGMLACPSGHDASVGWYVRDDGRIIGLGHEHLGGYLTEDGRRDLTGYRFAMTMPLPSRVVDLRGRKLVLRGHVKTRHGLRILATLRSGEEVHVVPSTPVLARRRRSRKPARKLRTLASFSRWRRAS